jgi:hypothetical protein
LHGKGQKGIVELAMFASPTALVISSRERNRRRRPLAAATLSVIVAPEIAGAGVCGFQPLTMTLPAAVAAIVVLLVMSAEAVQRVLYRKVSP